MIQTVPFVKWFFWSSLILLYLSIKFTWYIWHTDLISSSTIPFDAIIHWYLLFHRYFNPLILSDLSIELDFNFLIILIHFISLIPSDQFIHFCLLIHYDPLMLKFFVQWWWRVQGRLQDVSDTSLVPPLYVPLWGWT